MSSKDKSKKVVSDESNIASGQTSTAAQAQLRAQGWGNLLPKSQPSSKNSGAQPANLNENGEEDQGPDPEDNDNVVDSEGEGDHNEGEEESLAFEEIFESAQLLWLDTYGFSQSQLKLVEVTPGLNIDFANALISFAVEKADSDESLKRIRRDREALALLLQKEVGWSEKMIQEKVSDVLKAQETLKLGTQGPWPLGQTSSSQGVPYTGNAATMINVSGEKALRITTVNAEVIQSFVDHLQRSVSRGVWCYGFNVRLSSSTAVKLSEVVNCVHMFRRIIPLAESTHGTQKCCCILPKNDGNSSIKWHNIRLM